MTSEHKDMEESKVCLTDLFDLTIESENLASKKVSSDRNMKYREVIRILTENPVDIKITEEFNEKGQTEFAVPIKDLGIKFSLFADYKTEVFSNYVVDTIGELFVREFNSIYPF